MRVHVDPAGRDHQPVGIDLAPGRPLLAADGGDPAVCNGDVAAERRLAGPIHDRAATNNDVVHANLPEGSRRRSRADLLLLDEYCLTVGRETKAHGCSPPLQRHNADFHNTRSRATAAVH